MRPTTLAEAVRDYLRLTSGPYVNEVQGASHLRAARAIYRDWCDRDQVAWKYEMDKQLAWRAVVRPNKN